MSGTVSTKGPKCGRHFLLQLSSHYRTTPEFALFCSQSRNNWKLWHNKLGHPNSKIMLSLSRIGLISNIKVSSYDVVHDYSVNQIDIHTRMGKICGIIGCPNERSILLQ